MWLKVIEDAYVGCEKVIKDPGVEPGVIFIWKCSFEESFDD